jgi:hypothetical protein
MKALWRRLLCAWSGHVMVLLTPRQAGLRPIMVHLTAHSPLRVELCKRCGSTRMVGGEKNGRLQ